MPWPITLRYIFCMFILARTTFTHENDASHVQGHIRIKRQCIPNNVLQCMYSSRGIPDKSDGKIGSNCSMLQNQWKDLNCVNNSFGMYHGIHGFVSFGQGPLGINFRNQQPCELPGNHTRTEELLVAKAVLTVTVTSLEEKLKLKEDEIRDLKNKLLSVQKTSDWQASTIEGMEIQLQACKQGKVECRRNRFEDRNKSSTALLAAKSHIKQLEKDNSQLMEVNKELLETVARQNKQVLEARAARTACAGDYAECTTSLQICSASRNELTTRVEQEIENRKQYANKCHSDYEVLEKHLDDTQLKLRKCKVTSENTVTQNKNLRDTRDQCLTDLSETTEQYTKAKKKLSDCLVKRNITETDHEACSNEMKVCSARVTEITTNLRKCKSDMQMQNNTISALKSKVDQQVKLNAKYLKQINVKNRVITQLTDENHELSKKISQLEASDLKTNAKLSTCTIRVAQQEARCQNIQDELNNVKTAMIELEETVKRQFSRIRQYEKSTNDLTEQIRIIKIRVSACKNDHSKLMESYRGLTTKLASCNSKLSKTTVMYEVALNQRDKCLSGHNATQSKMDEWKTEYNKCSKLNDKLEQDKESCVADLVPLRNMFDQTKDENDGLVELNTNLKQRLTDQSELMKSMTRIQKKCEETNTEIESNLERTTWNLNEANQRAERLETSLGECQSAHNQSLSVIAELQSNLSFTSTLIQTLESRISTTTSKFSVLQTQYTKCAADLTQSKMDLATCMMKYDETKKMYNLQESQAASMVESLNLCRSNHTESSGQAKAWQRKHSKCQATLSAQTADYLAQIDKLKSTNIAATGEISSYEYLTKNLRAELEESKDMIAYKEKQNTVLGQKLNACKERLGMHQSTIDFLRDQFLKSTKKVTKFESQIRSLSQISTNCNEELANLKWQLKNVKEDYEKTLGRLTRCLDQTDIYKTCPPATGGETFTSESIGCMLQTHRAFTYPSFSQYCSSVNASVVALGGDDEKKVFRSILDMLDSTGQEPTRVWVTNTRQAGSMCSSLNLQGITQESDIKLIPTDCDSKLPGVCTTHGLHSTRHY